MAGAPPSVGSGKRDATGNPRSVRIRTWALLALLIAVIAAIRAPLRGAKGATKDPQAKKPEEPVKKDPPPTAKKSESEKVESGSPNDAADKPPGSEGFTTSVRVAALAYFALLIAVLAGLGIQGDLLARLIRNEPVVSAWAVVFTLVGGAAAAIVLLWPKAPAARWVLASGAALALVGVCWAVGAGTASLSVRETPSLDLSVVAKDANTVTVTADAASSSMRANETLLLRVIASDNAFVEDTCWSDETRPLDGVVLYWGDTGVTVAGVASTQWKADVRIDGRTDDGSEIRYICAKAVISPRPEEISPGRLWRGLPPEGRGVVAIADVTLVPSTSPPPTEASR